MQNEVNKLKDELEYRKTTKRDEIKVDLQRAEMLGDLFHENFPYDEAVAAQRLNEARIVEIQHAIKSLSKKRYKSKKVQIGSLVELLKDDGFVIKVRLVDEEVFKSRVYSNGITIDSTIGKNIFGKRINEVIRIQELGRDFTILSINI